jgi:nucleoside 2-deoxyribosyltransferase
MKQFVYLSGPMGGCSFKEMAAWRNYVADRLNSGTLTCILPTRSFAKDFKPVETDKWINRRDYFDCVRSQCILVNFLGMKEVSIGTIMEIAWAYQKQIHIVCVCDSDGPQNHPMLADSITHTVKTLDEGIAAVKELLSEGALTCQL